MIVVAKDGTGEFRRISDALAYLKRQEEQGEKDVVNPGSRLIYIRKGIYEERVEVTLPYVTMVGEDAEETKITYFLHALMPREDIGKLGTFRSYTMFVDTHDFTALNLTIENTAGSGPDIGQGLALYADGDRLIFEHCRILGGKDTLFTGPLPPYELKKYGFTGPKQFAERINGRHWYRDCYIEGDIDFIFGSATAYFEHCEIFSKTRNLPVNSFNTAASTAEGQKYGYVFESCRFTGECPQETVYLGRPWRNFAKTVILRSYLGPHIFKEGWHNWGKKDAESKLFYAEYQNFGAGFVPEARPSWVTLLSEEDAEDYTRQKVLGGDDHWLEELTEQKIWRKET